MAILAIDCSFGGHSVALLRKGRRAPATRHAPRVHASAGIIDSIDEVLSQSGVRAADLEAIACGIGPGNFSGIRSACGVAQGLSLVHGTGVAQVPTTLALAHASGCGKAIVAYPAHRGHCYLAAYDGKAGRLRERLAPSLWPLDGLPRLAGDWEVCARKMPGNRDLLAGCAKGKASVRTAWRGSLAPAIAELGLAMKEAGRLAAASEVRPLYVRNKVALTIEERKALRKQ